MDDFIYYKWLSLLNTSYYHLNIRFITRNTCLGFLEQGEKEEQKIWSLYFLIENLFPGALMQIQKYFTELFWFVCFLIRANYNECLEILSTHVMFAISLRIHLYRDTVQQHLMRSPGQAEGVQYIVSGISEINLNTFQELYL